MPPSERFNKPSIHTHIAALTSRGTLDEAIEQILIFTQKIDPDFKVYIFTYNQTSHNQSISLFKSHPESNPSHLSKIESFLGKLPEFRSIHHNSEHYTIFPLHSRSRPLGAIVVQSGKIRMRARDAKDLLLYASCSSITLENIMLSSNEWTQFPNFPTSRILISRSLEDFPLGGTLFLFDIDNFKKVNSEVGYFGGAELLRQIAKRFREDRFFKSGVLGHISGDEFLFFHPRYESSPHLAFDSIADLILSKFDREFSVFGSPIRTSVSIGSCDYPGDAASFEQLCEYSASALLMAKRLGGARHQSIRLIDK